MLTAVNDYSGGTIVNAGTLGLSGSSNLLSRSGAITVAGGVLDLGSNLQTTSGAISLQGGTVCNGIVSKSGADYDRRVAS